LEHLLLVLLQDVPLVEVVLDVRHVDLVPLVVMEVVVLKEEGKELVRVLVVVVVQMLMQKQCKLQVE
jgi:hypothetical protein